MLYLKYLLFTFISILLVACNSTKEPKKEEIKETNVTTIIEAVPVSIPIPISTLGELSPKQKVVKEVLDSYLQDLSTFNTDSIVDKTYPKLFNFIDLDLFRQYIASMMNSTDIEMQSYETNITKLSKVNTFSNNTELAQAEYISTIQLHFLNENLYDTEEKINFLYDALIHKYNTENIYINKTKRILRIKKLERLLIIKDKDSEWKFLGAGSKYRKVYPNFLPLDFQVILK